MSPDNSPELVGGNPESIVEHIINPKYQCIWHQHPYTCRLYELYDSAIILSLYRL